MVVWHSAMGGVLAAIISGGRRRGPTGGKHEEQRKAVPRFEMGLWAPKKNDSGFGFRFLFGLTGMGPT